MPAMNSSPYFQIGNTLLPLIHGILRMPVEAVLAIARLLPCELNCCHTALHLKRWKDMDDQSLATTI